MVTIKEVSSFLIHELTKNAKKKKWNQTNNFFPRERLEEQALVPEAENNCQTHWWQWNKAKKLSQE